MNIDARWCGRASGSVTAMTIRKSAIEALRGEPLVPVDDPVVAVAHRARLQQRRVRARRVGSVIENADLRSPASSGCSQRSFCSRRPGEREDLAVAGVRRLVAERVRRERRGAEDLVHQPELDLAEALAAELGVEVRGPQPALLDALLQRRVDAVELRLVELADDRLERPDLLAHELRASSRAAPGTPARSRSPMPCRVLAARVAVTS